MSTKQPAVAVASRSNQRVFLPLQLPLAKNAPPGIPFSKSSEHLKQTRVPFHKSFELVFLHGQ